MRPFKRKLFILFAVVLLVFILWMVYTALQTPVLAVGTELPSLVFEGCNGMDTLRVMEGQPVLLILFSKRCSHCLYEMDLLEKHFAELDGCQLYVITLDKDFRLCEDPLRWLNLASSERVKWCRAGRAVFKSAFGGTVSPSLFAFDGQGRLKNKIRGEVKIEKILASWK